MLVILVVIFEGGIIMNIIELQKKVEEILSDKSIKNHQYKRAFSLLDSIKDDETVRQYYDNYMGELMFRRGELAVARYYFLDQLSADYTAYSAHYNLYKIAVDEGNLGEALMNLDMYKKLVDNKKANVELPYSMLKLYMDLVKDDIDVLRGNYAIDSTDYFATTAIKDEEALDIYHKVIIAFNNRDMKAMKRYLNHLNFVVQRKNLDIDISSLFDITKALDGKLKEVCLRAVKEDPNMEQISILNYSLASVCIYNNYIDSKKALNMIDKVINRDPAVASLLLDKVVEHYRDVNDTDIEVDYLRNKIKEEKQYLFLSSSDKNVYDTSIEKARVEYDEKEYDNALNYYQAAALITEHPIFDYYMGKVLYKMGKLDEAYEYMQKYESHGGKKELHSLLYLKVMELKMKKHKMAYSRDNKSNKLVNYFQSNSNWHTTRKKQVSKKDLTINKTISNKMRDNDGQLILGNFNDYSFDDKLLIIRELYQDNQISLADSLMNKLEKSDASSDDKRNLNEERHKKKLYVNKGKRTGHN